MTDDDNKEQIKEEILARVFDVLANHMDSIMKIFKPGMLAAIVIWRPGEPDQDIVMNHPDSTLDEIIEVVARRIEESGRTLQ